MCTRVHSCGGGEGGRFWLQSTQGHVWAGLLSLLQERRVEAVSGDRACLSCDWWGCCVRTWGSVTAPQQPLGPQPPSFSRFSPSLQNKHPPAQTAHPAKAQMEPKLELISPVAKATGTWTGIQSSPWARPSLPPQTPLIFPPLVALALVLSPAVTGVT